MSDDLKKQENNSEIVDVDAIEAEENIDQGRRAATAKIAKWAALAPVTGIFVTRNKAMATSGLIFD